MTTPEVKTMFNYVVISKKEEEKLLDVARISNLVDTEIPHKHIYERVLRLIVKHKRYIHRLNVDFNKGEVSIDINSDVSLALFPESVSLIISNRSNETFFGGSQQTFFGTAEDLVVIERQIDEYFMRKQPAAPVISEQGLSLFYEKLPELEANRNKFSSTSLLLDKNLLITYYNVHVELDGYDALTLLKQKEHGGSSVVLLYNFWEEKKR